MDPNQQQQQPYYGYNQPVYAVEDTGKKRRIIMVGAGFTILLIIGLVLYSLIFSGPNLRPSVVKIAATHNELARIADLVIRADEGNRATQALAANMYATNFYATIEIQSWAKRNLSGELNQAELTSQKNEDITTGLNRAIERNSFDEEFADVSIQILNEANRILSSAYDEFEGYNSFREILDQAYTSNQVLMEQASALQ